MVLASSDRCEYIAVAADNYSEGGHGNDAATRKAKEDQANKVLLKCFGVSSVKDESKQRGMGALFVALVLRCCFLCEQLVSNLQLVF